MHPQTVFHPHTSDGCEKFGEADRNIVVKMCYLVFIFIFGEH